MNKIINLEQIKDYEKYNPLLILSEDSDFDNCFCILNTNMGDIAFSYYDLGIEPNYVIQDKILFLSFGKKNCIINLKEKNILYKSDNDLYVIFEIIKSELKSCIVFIGEMSLICFNFGGKRIWENNYRDIICDWTIMEEGISIIFENNEKWLVLFEDGNGIPVIF